jgi:Uma2 family endonuclease
LAAVQMEGPRNRRWSREEFYQMMDLGWFLGQSVELIRGEIMEMPNQKSGHYAGIDKTARCVERVFGPGYWVRTQAPIACGGDTEPNPDVSVVSGSREDYLRQHPTTALLVVEVSDSTLRYDRKTKGSIFASARIADYWIVNLLDRQVEFYRQPTADTTGEFDLIYGDARIYKDSEFLTPLAARDVQILPEELLP